MLNQQHDTMDGAGSLQALQFDNSFVRELPCDTEQGAHRREVAEACYSRVTPAPTSAPRLVAYSAEVATMLGLNPQVCTSARFTEVFSGNAILEGMDPFASCYGGHQFGNWAGQLGDGRAINLGEVLNEKNGAAADRWVLQLKGAGPTPYSRTADGLAVLRSSMREFLCSEAMHHLGVPTTRALSLCLTGDEVMRDILYDGHPQLEPGAVVCRVARSFTRFGHYQMIAARGETELLRRFFDYNVTIDFPQLALIEDRDERVLAWFEAVCERTATLIVHWMRVGFVHGVMNTDNMAILGDTIDYGPYGWLEGYDPNWTPNTTDAQGKRYRYSFQPAVAHWNLVQLANAIVPLVQAVEPLEAILKAFQGNYTHAWQAMMAGKLGLRSFDAGDEALTTKLDSVLQLAEIDVTLFYRGLADLDLSPENTDPMVALLDAAYLPEAIEGQTRSALNGWLHGYAARLRRDNRDLEERRATMNAVNPKYVLRNYMAQLATDAAEQGDFSLAVELLEVLRKPYENQPTYQRHAQKRPEWARTRVGCSMLSCSS